MNDLVTVYSKNEMVGMNKSMLAQVKQEVERVERVNRNLKDELERLDRKMFEKDHFLLEMEQQVSKLKESEAKLLEENKELSNNLNELKEKIHKKELEFVRADTKLEILETHQFVTKVDKKEYQLLLEQKEQLEKKLEKLKKKKDKIKTQFDDLNTENKILKNSLDEKFKDIVPDVLKAFGNSIRVLSLERQQELIPEMELLFGVLRKIIQEHNPEWIKHSDLDPTTAELEVIRESQIKRTWHEIELVQKSNMNEDLKKERVEDLKDELKRIKELYD